MGGEAQQPATGPESIKAKLQNVHAEEHKCLLDKHVRARKEVEANLSAGLYQRPQTATNLGTQKVRKPKHQFFMTTEQRLTEHTF